MPFEQYEHKFSESKIALVWVDSELKGKHREHCLCWKCDHFKPGTPENCFIADRVFQNCVSYNLVTPVYECPQFEEKCAG